LEARSTSPTWIIEAFDLDVALKLAAEGSKACNRKVEVRRNAAKAAGRAYGRRRCPAMASTSRIVHNRRTRKSWKTSGRRCRIGAEVFVAGVSGRPRGVPEPQEMIRDAVTGFRDL
jgi:hypothetical protein